MFSVNCIEKKKIKKKSPGMGHLKNRKEIDRMVQMKVQMLLGRHSYKKMVDWN